MSSVLDVLRERGFVAQTTHDEPLERLLREEKVTCYIGFDPTADSLHVGHLLQIMTLAHMQRAGHRPIALVGGGTAMIGDPSGRTEMRQMMTRETVAHNAACIKAQLSRYLDFSDDKALLVDNGDWLLPLNYVEFLREVGAHFSVNRMLTAEAYKSRMERGLTFIEFNYMLMQAYDFLLLYRKYGCRLEMGGDDQWSNILAGADLIRRVEGVEVYGITSPLITTAAGTKMGKTAAGAVWLDAKRTSPYEFYQYWRNADDADVERFLALYTLLPMDEVRRLGALKDKEINEAKRILAFEVTKLAHGEAEALAAQKAAEAVFGSGGDEAAMPTTVISAEELAGGIGLVDLMVRAGLAPSKKEARRLVEQGGVQVNGVTVTDVATMVDDGDVQGERILLKKGKKTFHRVVVK
ncbi:MAG TPA: tyrosine--tRNA ligase [Firmicutes bacterium]|jgi:tyrosyl-tRNA synthetase|nr:tyrosine--tRNA ligase [Bacillota bacterium]HOQ24156.1 tyrosine--tRNA ligase [Bacillota bacterium]HPT67567.1 tyrosine--tRNA ligase [Bacillota bacterium]